MARQRQNFISGTLGAQLNAGATSISSNALMDLDAIAGPDIAIIVLDPLQENGDPEIVYVTAHTAGQPNATISRGEEGTTDRMHPIGSTWKHAPVVEDWDVASVLFARKTADESVTNSTTLQDDNHLTLTVEANEIYEVSFNILYTADSTGDLKLQFEAPAGAVLDLGSARLGLSAASTSDDVTTKMQAGIPASAGHFDAGTSVCAFGQGLLVVGGTAGTFKLTWAQWAVSGTATTLKVNSYVCLRKVA